MEQTNEPPVYLGFSVTCLNWSFPWEEHLGGQGRAGSPQCPACAFSPCLSSGFPVAFPAHRHWMTSSILIL